MSKESDSLAVGDEITPYTMKSIIYLNNIKHFLESGSVLILGKKHIKFIPFIQRIIKLIHSPGFVTSER